MQRLNAFVEIHCPSADELETTLPDFFRKASGKTWYPQYVHFIVVSVLKKVAT